MTTERNGEKTWKAQCVNTSPWVHGCCKATRDSCLCKNLDLLVSPGLQKYLGPLALYFAIPDTEPGVGQGGISNGLCSIKLMAAFHGVY